MTRLDHNTGSFVSFSLREVCGFFNIPWKLTQSKGSIFSSLVLWLWVLVRSVVWTINLQLGSPAHYNVSELSAECFKANLTEFLKLVLTATAPPSKSIRLAPKPILTSLAWPSPRVFNLNPLWLQLSVLILGSTVFVRSGAWTLNLQQGSSALYNVS